MKKGIIFLAIIMAILLHSMKVIQGQVLNQMEISESLEEESIQYIVLNPAESIIIVHTLLAKMSFETPRGLLGVDNPEEGLYILHLNPGTNVVIFKSDGYVSQKKRFFIEPKKYNEVTIRPLLIKIDTITVVENKGEDTISNNELSPTNNMTDSTYSFVIKDWNTGISYGSSDDNYILHLSGKVILPALSESSEFTFHPGVTVGFSNRRSYDSNTSFYFEDKRIFAILDAHVLSKKSSTVDTFIGIGLGFGEYREGVFVDEGEDRYLFEFAEGNAFYPSPQKVDVIFHTGFSKRVFETFTIGIEFFTDISYGGTLFFPVIGF